MMNRTVVKGFIDTDIETRRIPNDVFTLVKFTIRVINRFRNRNGEIVEETSYFDVETFGNAAEEIDGKYKKGDEVICSGRLKLESFTDENGKRFSKVFLIATSVLKA